MATEEKPKVVEKIPVDRFHVSETNMNFGEPFGDSDEDKNLIAQLRQGEIVQEFKARPEGEGYGVYVGRRRFLGKKAVGVKHFVVGEDCIIKDATEEQALEASWIENWNALKKAPNPIARAKSLNKILTRSTGGLRAMARKWDASPSTLSEYLKVLDLSPKMQEALAKGLLPYKSGLEIARMGLGVELQDKLAEILEVEGIDAFKRELVRVSKGKGKRGIPRGVYDIDRVMWDKRSRKDVGYRKTVDMASEKKGMKRPEYIKDFIIRHIDEIRQEAKMA